MKLLVNGRHLGEGQFDSKNIVSEFYIHEDSVTLRMDDKENLAWWLEVNIPKEVLEKLLKAIDKPPLDIPNEYQKWREEEGRPCYPED